MKLKNIKLGFGGNTYKFVIPKPIVEKQELLHIGKRYDIIIEESNDDQESVGKYFNPVDFFGVSESFSVFESIT